MTNEPPQLTSDLAYTSSGAYCQSSWLASKPLGGLHIPQGWLQPPKSRGWLKIPRKCFQTLRGVRECACMYP